MAEKMKQVAVRMDQDLQSLVMLCAASLGIGFSEFLRQAAEAMIVQHSAIARKKK